MLPWWELSQDSDIATCALSFRRQNALTLDVSPQMLLAWKRYGTTTRVTESPDEAGVSLSASYDCIRIVIQTISSAN